jgi:hypothetical protein
MSGSGSDFIGGLLGTLQPAAAIRPRSFSLYDPQRPRLRGPEVDPEPAPTPFPPPAAPLGSPAETRHPDDRESRADSLSSVEHSPRPVRAPVPALGRQPELRPPRAPAHSPAQPAAASPVPVASHPVTPATGPAHELVDGSPGERGPRGPAGPRGVPGPPGSLAVQGETAAAATPQRPSGRHHEPGPALRPQSAERRAEVAAWPARRARTQERTVEITIDRLEVRAQPAPAAPSRRGVDRRPALNLDDYLRQRDNRNGVGT